MCCIMLNEQSISQKFWCHAIETASFIMNRTSITKTSNKTPYEILRKKRPSLGYFKIFGCKCIISKTHNGIFLGYSHTSKAYKVYNKETSKIIETLDVSFDEETCLPLEDKLGENNDQSQNFNHTNLVEIIDHNDENDLENDFIAQAQNNTFAFISTIEPKCFEEAIRNENWFMAMHIEIDQLTRNDVWELVPLPNACTPLELKWAFSSTLHENGTICENQAKLVINDLDQVEKPINQIFAPVAQIESLRILLAYACSSMIKLKQMDVKNAFNKVINSEIYVSQPPGFINFQKPNHVFKIKKVLHGLDIENHLWQNSVASFLVESKYARGMKNKSLFFKIKDKHQIVIQIFEDDIVFGSTCQALHDEFIKRMHEKFNMNVLGDLKSILNLQVIQSDNGTFISESKYLRESLRKFDLENVKSIKTPMATDLKLTLDKEGISVDSSKYRCMIGCLLHLTASRPDIMFSVSLCARFQDNPKESHMNAVVRIFRYLKSTPYLGVWYPKASGIEISIYTDSDHAGDYVDRKSTSGVCTFVGECLTQWSCQKQTALAISTTEAEYVAAGRACQQALWMKQMFSDYNIHLQDVLVLCDNKGAIDLSKNPVHHSRTKHIEIRHHILRDNVQKGNILLEKVASEDNVADILTKPLKRETFNYLRLGLGLIEHRE